MKWVYDRETRELVTREEYSKREALRRDKYGKKHFDMPQNFRRGHWKRDPVTREFIEIAPKDITPRAPIVQTDEIPPTESLATAEGKVFTSKKKLYQHYKENGVTVREKGMNVRPPDRYKANKDDIREDAAKALNDLRWGNVSVSEWERECNLREQRKLEQYKKNH